MYNRNSPSLPAQWLLLTATLAFAAAATPAATIYVCWDGTGDYLMIQEGIDAAVDGDEVVVCDGMYIGPGNRGLNLNGKAITVRSANGPETCVIDCQYAARAFNVYSAEDRQAVIEGFTITRGSHGYGGAISCTGTPIIRNCQIIGNWARDGGGIFCRSGSPTVIDCVITGNTADFNGGGVAVRQSPGDEFTMIRCEVSENTAPYGGGIWASDGQWSATDCKISANTAEEGGGMYVTGGSPTFNQCVVSHNSATLAGGGANLDGAVAAMSDCSFTDNDARTGAGLLCLNDADAQFKRCWFMGNAAIEDGGGAFCFMSEPQFRECTFTANAAERSGGALYASRGSPWLLDCAVYMNITAYPRGTIACVQYSDARLFNCSITDNTLGGLFCSAHSNPLVVNCLIADNETAGVACERNCEPLLVNCTIAGNVDVQGPGAIYAAAYSFPTLVNCILWNDAEHEIGDIVHSETTVRYSIIRGGWPGVGNLDADPLFRNPNQGNYRPLPDSPSIDAGCNGAVPLDTADLDHDGDLTEVLPLDLDGQGRFADNASVPDDGCGTSPIVDMGAYEYGQSGPQPCPGDMDGDRDVDQSDLGILLSAWGASGECDLNCDGEMDDADLGILLGHFGAVCP